MIHRLSFLSFLFLLSFSGSTQESDSAAKEEARLHNLNHKDIFVKRKGKAFFSWGYNRSTYSLSDIRYWGNGYDFTIKEAVAKDRQTKFDPKVYFNPALLTIPQYNLRLGYYLNNKLSLSVSVDHMKYVLDNSQIATVDGIIEASASTTWAKEYDQELMPITQDFVKYEHTDGLNIIYFELDYNDLFFETSNRNFAVDLVTGIGAGAAVPKTNARLFDKLGTDDFHLAGWSVNANVGLKLFFFKKLFLHPAVKTGFVILPDVRTNLEGIDKASQNFSYFQGNITLGYQFRFTHN